MSVIQATLDRLAAHREKKKTGADVMDVARARGPGARRRARQVAAAAGAVVTEAATA